MKKYAVLLFITTMTLFSNEQKITNFSFGAIVTLLPHDSVTQYKEHIKEIAVQAFKVVYSDQWNDAFEKAGLEKIDRLLKEYQTDSDKMFWMIAHEKQELVGWALFVKDDQKKDRALINQISVRPDQWRKGIGHKLVFSIIDYWKECKIIALTTRKSNKISHKFYKSLGFSESDFMPEQDATKEMQGYEYIYE